MRFRAAVPSDAARISALILSFQDQLTLQPDGRGAEAFLASVSEPAERDCIASARFEFLLAEQGRTLAGCIALRDRTHLFHLFVAREFQRIGLARALWHQVRRPGVGYTVNASLAAVPVYARLGFVAAGECQQQHGIEFLPMRLPAA